MKNLVMLFLFCILISMQTQSQQLIVVSEDSLLIGTSRLPCFLVNIPEAKYDDVLRAWTRELESGTRSKVHIENGEMQILGGKIRYLSKEAINVYSKIERFDSMLVLFATFETRKDQYITNNSDNAKYLKTRDFLKDFAKNEYINVVKAQADAEAKKLRELENELSSLEKEKLRMEKSIETSKSKIITEKENIILLNNGLQITDASLVRSDSLLLTMVDEQMEKENENQKKELEKSKRKALNSIHNSEKKISRLNEKIEKATRDIPQNERMQDMVRLQIVNQQEVYQRFLAKLNTIKSY